MCLRMAKAAAAIAIVGNSQCSFTHFECVIMGVMCKYLFFGSTGRQFGGYTVSAVSHDRGSLTGSYGLFRKASGLVCVPIEVFDGRFPPRGVRLR